MSELEYPQDLRYTAEHEWLRTGEDGVVRIGITSFAQEALGDVVYVSLPAVGDDVSAGDACGEVESTKSVSDLFAPADGEVLEVNEAIVEDPGAVNLDPFGSWLFRMRMSARPDLLDAPAYAKLIGDAS